MIKKLYKKLVLSIIAVAFAFTALGTSTYAWFSMNKTVSVTGMSITATSDSVYLLIGSVNDINAVQNDGLMTVNYNMTSTQSKVMPAAHDALTNSADANTVSKWYYQIADEPTASTSTDEKNYLTSDNFATYVIHKVCYITVTVGSNPAENLIVSGVTINSNASATGNNTTLEPVKIIVASSTAIAEFDSANTASDTVLVDSIDDQTLVAVDIFLYYDGNNAKVFTNNMANLDGANIEIEFTVD